jgi:ABC-type antimicrobial peptide transport system permease subunit
VVHDIDPRLWVGETLTASQRIDRTLGREHLIADLSGAFGVLTLLLVSVGVYGTLAYAVSRRTREIGVRIALGAKGPSVMGLVLQEVASVVVAGVVAGVMLSALAGRLVQSLLFGLAPTDPGVLFSAVSVLVVVALTAGVVPALRASRLDPAEVLRE